MIEFDDPPKLEIPESPSERAKETSGIEFDLGAPRYNGLPPLGPGYRIRRTLRLIAQKRFEFQTFDAKFVRIKRDTFDVVFLYLAQEGGKITVGH